MLDISTINKRYFSIKIDNLNLEVEPPKMKALRKIASVIKTRNEDAVVGLSEALKMILSKNKTGYQVPDEVIDELDYDQMNEILTAYFKWLEEVKNSPN